MAELSGHWTTTAGGTGHQQTSYTQAQLSTAYKVIAGCGNYEGVCPGLGNMLICAANGANTVSVGTGGAVVDGKWYYNDASLDVNIPSASGAGNTRIDRIVLRANWAGYEVAVTRIAGTDAASPSVPSLTRTSGTTYDIHLARVTVNTAGAVTVIYEPTMAYPYSANGLAVLGRAASSAGTVAPIYPAGDGLALRRSGTTIGFGTITGAGIANDAIDSQHYAAGSIDLEHMSANSVDSDQYVDGSIDPIHIANRTRTAFVPAITPNPEPAGCVLPDSASTSAYGYWQVPADYVSGMQVKALVIAAWPGSGNIYAKNDVVIESVSESSNYGAEAVTYSGYAKVRTVTIAGAPSAGDGVYMRFTRDATHANDTVNAVCLILGWQVSYTADS